MRPRRSSAATSPCRLPSAVATGRSAPGLTVCASASPESSPAGSKAGGARAEARAASGGGEGLRGAHEGQEERAERLHLRAVGTQRGELQVLLGRRELEGGERHAGEQWRALERQPGRELPRA